MPKRAVPLVKEHIYHIYNRGVEKRQIFQSTREYERFIQTVLYYQIKGPKPKFSQYSRYKTFKLNPTKKIVEIICYCLMPNHFHLIVKQLTENGISEFMSKLEDSYTKYFNIKHDRVGPLLQGEFKSVLVETDEQLLHLSRYIHLNPVVGYLTKSVKDYPWSSHNEYTDRNLAKITNPKIVLDFFPSAQAFNQFVLDQADYGKQLELIKHKIIEEF